MQEKVLRIINTVLENKGQQLLTEIKPEQELRVDLGFDSLDLAELTVRIEKEFGVDIFADGFITTIGEIFAKLNKD